MPDSNQSKFKETKTPPKWMDKIIKWVCPDHLLEEVIGDLHERYSSPTTSKGRFQTNQRYLKEVLFYVKATAFQRERISKPSPYLLAMIKHYFLTITRHISKNKAFSFINVTGLALGITSFLLIMLWVNDERSIDNFHKNQDDLYSLYVTKELQGEVTGDYLISEYEFYNDFDDDTPWFSDNLKPVFPEIKYISSYATSYELPWGYPTTFQIGDISHKLKGSIVGGDFLKMFSYDVLIGDGNNALDEINSIAISEYMASLYFTTPEEAIGQTIRYENRRDLIIKAVFKDVGPRSSLKFDFLMSWKNAQDNSAIFSDNKWPTFIQLAENVDPIAFEKKLAEYHKPFQNDRFGKFTLGIQPFGDRYLKSGFENGKPVKGRIEYVRIFSGVAVFILIIACINFTNLTTARSIKRAKEVGVRKVIGSTKLYLIGQFLGESIFLTTIATLLSILAVSLVLPVFNAFTDKAMLLPFNSLNSWLFIVGLILITGFLSGCYPALFLSSLKPAKVLKGLTRFTRSAQLLRKGLAIFQFSLSILLLIATLVVSKQTNYIKNANLGYDKENVIYVRVEGDLVEKYQVFKETLLTKPGIAMVDRSSEAPHDMGFEIAGPFIWEGMEEGRQMSFKPTSVGFDFLEMMNLEVVDGRGFDKTIPTDTAAFMINETALTEMGLDSPLGKRIAAWGKQGRIIGILKDYHTHSLHEPIKPLIVDVKEDLNFGIIMIKSLPGQTTTALRSLEEVSAEVNPNHPLNYQFMDLEYAALYKNEQVISSLSNVFAVLAILISCLGLLGLAMFSAEQRIKEIGIRKVLGASVASIIGLFSKDFIKLVAFSFIIAMPISLYLMQEWLASFAYRIALSWWIFALTGLLALFIAFITVAYQTLKAARANPIHNLRVE